MLELKHISFDAADSGGKKEILKDISFTLEDNTFVAVTGPNGGGKSTLAKLIAGIEKPSSGQILYNGQDITPLSITERARLGISYAFQQPVRFKGITVIDLIRLAAGRNLTFSEACEYLSQVAGGMPPAVIAAGGKMTALPPERPTSVAAAGKILERMLKERRI